MKRFVRRYFCLLSAALFLGACAAILAPAYDAELVEGLSDANEATLTLFSGVSAGATRGNFKNHQESYDAIIGQFDALRVRANAREMPAVPVKIVSKLGLGAPECGEVADCINPTPAILETLLSGLRRMRDQHRSNGVPDDQVSLYKNGYEISITQALTVERAFQR